MTTQNTILEAAIAAARARTSWNSWLEAAEKPASDHEEAKIERAARLAKEVVDDNTWLRARARRFRKSLLNPVRHELSLGYAV